MEVKGKATVRDIAHGMGAGVAGSTDLSNVEILLGELIHAVRDITITVDVPPSDVPEVVVNVATPPDPAIDYGPVVEAIKSLKLAAVRSAWEPGVVVNVPQPWLVYAVLFALAAADIVFRVIEAVNMNY